MGKNGSTIGQAQDKAKKAILTRYKKTAGNSRNGARNSWPKLGNELGFSGAYLSSVAAGRRKASLRLLKALNIKPDAVVIMASPCKKCGSVHVAKRCTHRKTFEDNAREYDEWLRDPKTQAKLKDMLQWAESVSQSAPEIAIDGR